MTAVIVEKPGSDRERFLRTALQSAGCKFIIEPDARRIRGMFETGTVDCVVAALPGDVHDAAHALRDGDRGAQVPLIALSEQISERAMLSLLALGADDVIAEQDVGGLVRRIKTAAAMPKRVEPAPAQGMCLVAHEDAAYRNLLCGVLRQAGFDVLGAATSYETLAVVVAPNPVKVVLVSEGLPPDGGRATLARLALRLGRGRVSAVMLSKSGYAGARSPEGFVQMPEQASLNDLLFAVHELTRPRELLDVRASRRVLHATLCTFAPDGELFERSCGLTYNISAEGLYVRTLDPPPVGQAVWLALKPPGLAYGAVRLGGQVVWSRTRLTRGASAAPTGFAVRLTESACPPSDRARYIDGYERLLKSLG